MTLKQTIARAASKVLDYTGVHIEGYDFFSADGKTDDWRRDRHREAYFSNAWRACALAKARPLAALPVHVYEREDGIRKESNKRPATDLSRLLRGRWNPYMTAPEGFRWVDMKKDLEGNAFVRYEWRNGRIVALWPLSGTPTVRIGAGGYPVFEYCGDKFTPPGMYLAYEIAWVKSPILDADGLYGRSLAELAARELNLSIDLEEFYSHVVNGEGNFPGWVEIPGKLNDQDFKRFKKQFEDGGGIASAGKLRFLDQGASIHMASQSMVDMSLVEQEKWILQQTCRTLSVPPQEVFDLSNATYSNIEQGALNFANKTLVPEAVELERAFTLPLHAIGLDECYVQFDMNGLLRGSYKDRMDGYRIAIFSGWLTRADVRAKEDEPPIPGLDSPLLPTAYNLVDPETGDVVYVNQQNAPAQKEPGSSGEGAPPYSGDGDGEALNSIHSEMGERIRARVRENGDTTKTREFAAKVLKPYADACLIAHREYDMQSDIEGIISNA